MKTPTDIHPALTEYRLDVVGQIIRESRHLAAMLHSPSSGDNGWVLGSRQYAWNCHAIVRATAEHGEWLRIIEGGGHVPNTDDFWTSQAFCFAIGPVPIKFYRGKPSAVRTKTANISFPELQARQSAFLFAGQDNTPDVKAIRLAVEMVDGEVSRITLVQVDSNSDPVGDGWVIPEQPSTKVAQFPRKEEGKDLGKPQVGPRRKPEEEEEEH